MKRRKTAITADEFSREKNYWLNKLSGEWKKGCFPYDHKSREANERELRQIAFSFRGALYAQLLKLSSGSDVNLHMILAAGLLALLYRYTCIGQDDDWQDITVAAPIYRQDIEAEFINSVLVLRNQTGLGLAFKDLLLQLRETIIEAEENLNYPLERIAEKLKIGTGEDSCPLFDIVILLENIHDKEYIRDTAPNMIFSFLRTEESLEGTVEYNGAVYRQSTVERIVRHLRHLLQNILNNIKLVIGSIDILTEAEKRLLVSDFNNTQSEYPRDKVLHQLFAEQVVQRPDRIAVMGPRVQTTEQFSNGRHNNISITYNELNIKSNQLGHLLRQNGMSADAIVGIMVERSIEMMIGILGILKAGAAYLPIDPDYPEKRISYMLMDTRTNILLTTPNLSEKFEKLSFVNCQLLMINEKKPVLQRRNIPLEEASPHPPLPSVPVEAVPSPTLTCQVSPARLAYIIYTSGSTGKPKGVMVDMGPVINLLVNLQREYPLEETGVYLLKTSFIFDVSVTELFGWFPGGGRLDILSPGDEKDPWSILDTIERRQVTHINFVPSLFRIFLDILNSDNIKKLSHLRYIFLAGEALSPRLVKKAGSLNMKVALENLYGPTEAAVYASGFSLSQWNKAEPVPIGKPLANNCLYILDCNLQILPIGIPGQLCIAGDGLARGYLNKPELTAEKFVYKALSSLLLAAGRTGRAIFYLTGDLGRWLPDGNIKFLGRIDHQVKVRGFRIELGEIENRLLSAKGVKEAVVLTKNDKKGDKYLCAYIVTNGRVEVTGLKKLLSSVLPAYMVPSFFVILERIPLTPNGKVHWRMFPDPQVVSTAQFTAPGNEIEEKLEKIWKNELGLEKIGIYDNFFYLGGNSLMAIRLINKINKEFNLQINLQNIYKTFTIKALSEMIAGKSKGLYNPKKIEAHEEKQYYEVSIGQERAWNDYKLDPANPARNIFFNIVLYEVVDENIVKKVLEKLVIRHKSLRTSFKEINGKPVQIIHTINKVDIEMVDISHLNEEGLKSSNLQFLDEYRMKPFTLEDSPLFRVKLVKCRENEFVLIIALSHVISDGWSLNVLKQEFWILYESYKKGTGHELEPLKFQFKDYVLWHRKLITGDRSARVLKKFWRDRLGSDFSISKIPYDNDGKKSPISFESSKYRIAINEIVTEKLRTYVKENNTSLFMLLAAALNLLIYRITGNSDIIISILNANRHDKHLENVVGWFVGPVLIRNRINPNQSFGNFLKKVTDTTFKTLKYPIYPIELLFEKLKIRLHWQEILSIFFNMTAFGDSNLEELEDFDSYHVEKVQPSKVKFGVYSTEFKNGIEISALYFKDLYNKSTIERVFHMYAKIIENISDDPNRKIETIF